MQRTALLWVCSSALLANCGDPRTHEDDDETLERDASVVEAAPGPASDAAAAADGSTATCTGADPLSQLVCQLFPTQGAPSGSAQPSLEDLLGILTGLGGALGQGAFDAGIRSGAGAPTTAPGVRLPTEQECMNPADARIERLCGLGRGERTRPPRDSGRGPDATAPQDNNELRDSGVPSPAAPDASSEGTSDSGITEPPALLDAA